MQLRSKFVDGVKQELWRRAYRL